MRPASTTLAGILAGILFGACAVALPPPARAADPYIPVLVPITGFLPQEGKSQRNGAVLALQTPPAGMSVRFDVADTGTTADMAVAALDRLAGSGQAIAVIAPILGTQVLAMMPVAKDKQIPLVTVSGTAALTADGNPYVFRFIPEAAVAKNAQIRFALEDKGLKRPAVLFQTSAYGQAGHDAILKLLQARNVAPVYEEGLDVGLKDMAPVLARVRAAGADGLILHLHGGPTALLLKAMAATKPDLPVIAASGLALPSTTALLEPAELAGVCAESGSAPLAGETAEMRDFLAAYRRAFDTDPDAFAVGQYDGARMVLDAIAKGADTPAKVTAALSGNSYQGLAMQYKSDGTGAMAHSAVIVCFDRGDRTPSVVKHYTLP